MQLSCWNCGEDRLVFDKAVAKQLGWGLLVDREMGIAICYACEETTNLVERRGKCRCGEVDYRICPVHGDRG